MMESHLYGLYVTSAPLSSASSSATACPSLPSLSLIPTTPEWCEQTLSSLKPRCATGLDRLPSSALIASRSVICYPLSSIINSSITSSQFPAQWKCASIRPLHKGGDRANPSNFRPISILPVPSKLLEKHVHLQLSSHLNSNNLLFSLQSGFRPSHSTQTFLLYCLDRWYRALDKRSFIGVVFLDITKAFLTLSPTIFCYPSYPVLVSLLLLSPGFNHIFRIVATSLKLLTLTLLLASLPLVSLKTPYLFPPSSLHSSTISLLSSPVTQQFCSLMTPPSTLSVKVFPPSSHLFSSA